MSTALDSMVSRRKLRSQLRALRVSRGFTLAEVARKLHWSATKLGRIESGEVTISITDLRALLGEYGSTTDAQVQAWEDLASAARARGEASWAARYRGKISDAFFQFLSLEASARVIRNYEPLVVPGLLQVPEYSHALFGSVTEDASEADRDMRDELLDLRKDAVFGSSSILKRYFIFGEAALRQQIGGPRVLRQQLQDLREKIDHEVSGLKIRVVPFEFDAHPGFQLPYMILELRGASTEAIDSPTDLDVDRHVLFLEDEDNELIIEEGEEDGVKTLRYLNRFWQLSERVTRADTVRVIDRAMRDVSRA
jgi:transcriptional regulator with XRE-family HTH domain